MKDHEPIPSVPGSQVELLSNEEVALDDSSVTVFVVSMCFVNVKWYMNEFYLHIAIVPELNSLSLFALATMNKVFEVR